MQKVPGWLPKVMENLKSSKLKPIFSHEVIVSSMVKVAQTKEGTQKEAQVILIFVDLTNLQPVGKYIISFSTANGLVNALQKQLETVKKQIEEKEVAKEEKLVTSTSEKELSYIG